MTMVFVEDIELEELLRTSDRLIEIMDVRTERSKAIIEKTKAILEL